MTIAPHAFAEVAATARVRLHHLLMPLLLIGAGACRKTQDPGVVMTLGHTPKHVSNVNQINDPSDSNPAAFASGEKFVYFTAQGSVLANGNSVDPAQHRIYRVDATAIDPTKTVQATAVRDEPIAKPADRIAIVSRSGQPDLVAFTIGDALWLGDGSQAFKNVSAPAGYSLRGLRSTGATCYAALQTTDKQAIASVDFANSKLTIDTNSEAMGTGLSDFVGLTGSNEVAWLSTKAGKSYVLRWAPADKVQEISIDSPQHLTAGATRFLVAGTEASGAVHAYWIDANTKSPLPNLSCEAIYGLAAGPNEVWVLAKIGGKTGLWRHDGQAAKEVVDLAQHKDPRCLVALQKTPDGSAAAAFVTDAVTLWSCDPTKGHPSGSNDMDPAPRIQQLFAMRKNAFYAAHHKTLGTEPWYWWVD